MKDKSLRLAAVGDICLADSAFCIGMGARSQIERLGAAQVTERLVRVLGDADGAIGNLEAVHSDIGRSRYRLWTVEMRGKPEHLDILCNAGFRVLNVANNHVFQHGLEAYADSKYSLQKRGLSVIGHDEQGCSVPVIMTKGEVKLICVGLSLRPEQYRLSEPAPYSIRHDDNEVLAEVARLRKAQPDGILVCSLHWGHEYVGTPSREQQTLARALIDSGVSVVLGHHPHVLQGIEEYQGGLIAYSLGNFVFDLREPLTLSTGVLVLDFDRDGLSDWEWRPAVIADDFLPDVLNGESRNAAQERMRDLCAGIHACALPLAADLEVAERRLSRQSSLFTYRFFARHLHKYDPLLAMQSVARAFFRRVGLAHDP